MMTMSGRVTVCCVALLLTLSSVSAIKKLNSIKDLKEINFGQSVPTHSLLLLHWFANAVEVDSNNVIWLTFDPNTDYGSHHYGNYEDLLDQEPHGYQYFTVGNLNEDGSDELPDYVTDPPAEYDGDNRDRIIFSVREQNRRRRCSRRIGRVFITQHYDASELGTYDEAHTYEITTNLLQLIRRFSVEENQQPLEYLRNSFIRTADDFQLQDIRNTWGDLACLGLLLFIVIKEKRSSNKPDFVVDMPENSQNHRNICTRQTCIIGLVLLCILLYVIWNFVIR